MKIPYVDDKTENRYFLKSVRQAGGSKTVSTLNGNDVLIKLLETHSDLVISHSPMPEQNLKLDQEDRLHVLKRQYSVKTKRGSHLNILSGRYL